MKAQIILVTMAILLCLDHATCYDPCDVQPYVNGCSIPANLPYFYKDVFRPDCNKHDVCYGCGEKFGISRRECDKRLYARIIERCRTDRSVRYEGWCNAVTTDYYLGVRLGGKRHYHVPAELWCNQPWVNQCL
ncbi:hypothetical protein ACF0H5_002962 [Mactra antiquata]